MPVWLALVFCGGPARAEETSTAASPDASAIHGSAFVDPLGFLLFGPRVGFEVARGQVAGALYGRWFDGGLLSRKLFPKDNEKFAFSYGVGLRGRYYFSDGLEGAHAGLALEFLRSRIENDTDMVATNSTYLVPQVEGGYRWTFGRFYVDAAAALGYAFRVSSSVDNLKGGNAADSFEVVNESTVYGAASLDLGVYFF